MERRTTTIVAAGAIALAALGIGTAVAAGVVDDDETETPITGDALRRASAAALAYTGEGRVTGTEIGDEESMYEVEITLDNGQQVDVQLDRNFRVVGDEADDESEPGDD
jgi:hypothetical protein